MHKLIMMLFLTKTRFGRINSFLRNSESLKAMEIKIGGIIVRKVVTSHIGYFRTTAVLDSPSCISDLHRSIQFLYIIRKVSLLVTVST